MKELSIADLDVLRKYACDKALRTGGKERYKHEDTAVALTEEISRRYNEIQLLLLP